MVQFENFESWRTKLQFLKIGSILLLTTLGISILDPLFFPQPVKPLPFFFLPLFSFHSFPYSLSSFPLASNQALGVDQVEIVLPPPHQGKPLSLTCKCWVGGCYVGRYWV